MLMEKNTTRRSIVSTRELRQCTPSETTHGMNWRSIKRDFLTPRANGRFSEKEQANSLVCLPACFLLKASAETTIRTLSRAQGHTPTRIRNVLPLPYCGKDGQESPNRLHRHSISPTGKAADGSK